MNLQTQNNSKCSYFLIFTVFVGLLCKLVNNLIKLIYQTHINAISSLSKVNENPNVKSS